jgi:hypothetical protein
MREPDLKALGCQVVFQGGGEVDFILDDQYEP